jgi:hypothetical protein
MNALLHKDLYRACSILFGPGVDVSVDFLFYIQPSGIKSAYRRRALATHPDRAAGSGVDALRLSTDQFIETHWAYERLLKFVTKRDRMGATAPAHPARQAREARAARPRPAAPRPHTATGGARSTARPKGHYYKTRIPARRMQFGEYLYYAGHVPWETLIKAIVWQRAQRPRLGDLALKRGWLEPWHLKAVGQRRKLGEQVGEVFVRLGYLSRARMRSLVYLQRSMQRPIGEYFTAGGYLSPAGLAHALKDFHRHNIRHSSN